MRDPNRIEDFLDNLKSIWELHPDWRFGQLVVNIFGVGNNPAFFYKEDEDFMDIMEEWLQDVYF